jgi:hypothetical protein
MVDHNSPGEYDQEGKMARQDLHTMVDAAKNYMLSWPATKTCQNGYKAKSLRPWTTLTQHVTICNQLMLNAVKKSMNLLL